jgi:hypothetical protein
MNLYYEVGDQQVGPIGKSELQSLVKAKKLNAKTMVWQERNRQGKGVQKNSPADPVSRSVCSECGQAFAEEDMIRFQDSWVCAGCKPVFIQKVKEGVSVAGAMDYAGFWIRFAAFAGHFHSAGDIHAHISRQPDGCHLAYARDHAVAVCHTGCLRYMVCRQIWCNPWKDGLQVENCCGGRQPAELSQGIGPGILPSGSAQ